MLLSKWHSGPRTKLYWMIRIWNLERDSWDWLSCSMQFTWLMLFSFRRARFKLVAQLSWLRSLLCSIFVKLCFLQETSFFTRTAATLLQESLRLSLFFTFSLLLFSSSWRKSSSPTYPSGRHRCRVRGIPETSTTDCDNKVMFHWSNLDEFLFLRACLTTW